MSSQSNVVLVGHPFVPIGVGEHLRASFRAFRSVGVNVGVRDIYGFQDMDADLHNEFKGHLVHQFSREINIFYVNGDEVEGALKHLGTDLPKNAYNVIYPMWELSKYPNEWARQLERFDEIWAPSKFTQESIASAVSRPVFYMPLAGQIELNSFLGRRHFGIPESSFAFLFFFDFTSYLARKNPDAVLAAFEKLSSRYPHADLCLMIKIKGGEKRGADYQVFCDHVARYKSRVHVIDNVLSDNEIKNLLWCCDCFVSLHRSEGFGLGLIAAMFLGKPVVATAYSANMDFMNEENSCLVKYQLCGVPSGAYPFSEGQVWAEPDIEHAVDQMAKLLTDRGYARELGERASRHIRVNFGYRATGLRYLRRVSEITAESSDSTSIGLDALKK